MNNLRIFFTLVVLLSIAFGLGCTSKKSEEKKESAQISTQTGQVQKTVQPAQTTAQTSQKEKTQEAGQASSTQPQKTQQISEKTAELRKQAMTKCEQTFETLDTNKDGVITTEELADGRLQRIMRKDQNGDKVVTLDELCSFEQKRRSGPRPKELRDMERQKQKQ